MTVPCDRGSVSLFQPQVSPFLTQFSYEVCHSCLDMGHLAPDCVWITHLIFSTGNYFSLSAWWDSSVPRKDFMPTGCTAEPGFGPINSSGERLCLISFPASSRQGQVVFPSTLRRHSLNRILSIVHSFPGHILSSANLIPTCTAPQSKVPRQFESWLHHVLVILYKTLDHLELQFISVRKGLE